MINDHELCHEDQTSKFNCHEKRKFIYIFVFIFIFISGTLSLSNALRHE